MPGIDYQAVRKQTSMADVLRFLNFVATETSGDQVRGVCPIHETAKPDDRTFSANLRGNTYQCFKCGSKGNQLDLWAAATNQRLYQAASDLCEKLHIEPPLIKRW